MLVEIRNYPTNQDNKFFNYHSARAHQLGDNHNKSRCYRALRGNQFGQRNFHLERPILGQVIFYIMKCTSLTSLLPSAEDFRGIQVYCCVPARFMADLDHEVLASAYISHSVVVFVYPLGIM